MCPWPRRDSLAQYPEHQSTSGRRNSWHLPLPFGRKEKVLLPTLLHAAGFQDERRSLPIRTPEKIETRIVLGATRILRTQQSEALWPAIHEDLHGGDRLRKNN